MYWTCVWCSKEVYFYAYCWCGCDTVNVNYDRPSVGSQLPSSCADVVRVPLSSRSPLSQAGVCR